MYIYHFVWTWLGGFYVRDLFIVAVSSSDCVVLTVG